MNVKNCEERAVLSEAIIFVQKIYSRSSIETINRRLDHY